MTIRKSLNRDGTALPHSAFDAARIAATLFAGQGTDLVQDGTYVEAAAAAVALLRACDDELRWQEYLQNYRNEAARREAAWSRRRTRLAQKYSSGILPWLSGLLEITGKRSDTDGSPLFRKWREYETTAILSRQAVEGANRIPGISMVGPEDAYRKDGFRIDEVLTFGLRYELWLREHQIPAVRRGAGLKSAELRRDKRKSS